MRAAYGSLHLAASWVGQTIGVPPWCPRAYVPALLGPVFATRENVQIESRVGIRATVLKPPNPAAEAFRELGVHSCARVREIESSVSSSCAGCMHVSAPCMHRQVHLTCMLVSRGCSRRPSDVLPGLQHSTAVRDELLCCISTLAYGVHAFMLLQQLQASGHAQASLVILPVDVGQS